MEQLEKVKECLASFDCFMSVLSSPESDPITLRKLCDEVYEKEHLADIALRRMIDSLSGTMFITSTRED
jgi:uncharacterized protein Yka (UPF0111/DUF47 family)